MFKSFAIIEQKAKVTNNPTTGTYYILMDKFNQKYGLVLSYVHYV